MWKECLNCHTEIVLSRIINYKNTLFFKNTVSYLFKSKGLVGSMGVINTKYGAVQNDHLLCKKQLFINCYGVRVAQNVQWVWSESIS
jgi:hypothetical protein